MNASGAPMHGFQSAVAARDYALSLVVAGRLADATAAAEEAVSRAPDDAESLHVLGIVRAESGRLSDAVALFDATLLRDPAHAPAHNSRGSALASLGQLDAAIASFERATELEPGFIGARFNLGQAYLESGRADAAVACFDAVLAAAPADGDVRLLRARALGRLGHFDRALVDYAEILARVPRHPLALAERIGVLLAADRAADAVAAAERAIALGVGAPMLYANLAEALQRLDRHDAALAVAERAIEAHPQDPFVHFRRATALTSLGRPDAARAAYEATLARLSSAVPDGPRAAERATLRGLALLCLGRHADAEQAYAEGLDRHPADPALRLSLGMAQLSRGNFAAGWRNYEARIRNDGRFASFVATLGEPMWTGREPLDGRRVLLHAEQGFGDTLQFCRYAPLLADRGAGVVLHAPPRLRRLLTTLDERIKVVGFDAQAERPQFHAALASLPFALGTTFANLPCSIPYLAADPARIEHWRTRLAGAGNVRVGIAWQGNAATEKSALRGRSVPATALGGLARLSGVQLISLQVDGDAELAAAGLAPHVQSFGAELDRADAFIDTAAIMMSIDLVVTSDTAIAHLAGALGVPVWVALHATADWRWFQDRADSPWYPTMRLFRQSVLGDWGTVFVAIKQALGELLNGDARLSDLRRVRPTG